MARGSKTNKTMRAIVSGKEDLSSWTNEELERGMKRDRNGRFRRPSEMIARQVHDALVRRKMRKAYNLLRESTYDAVRTLREIVDDRDADAGVRVKAAELILDRTLGKAPQTVEITADLPFQRMIAAAIVGTEEQASEASEVIDAEIVEDD